MTGTAPLSGITEGGKVENNENDPPFSAVIIEAKPSKPMDAGNDTQLCNPSPRPCGRSPKKV